jgi:hypothetical protein
MRMERLCLRDDFGNLTRYDGNIGSVVFVGGVSLDEWDVEGRIVRRLLSAEDGGMNLCPQMRIVQRVVDATQPVVVPVEVNSDGVDREGSRPDEREDRPGSGDGREAVAAEDRQLRKAPRSGGKRGYKG